MASEQDSRLKLIESRVKAFPDFPKKGILFRDICPILKDPEALSAVTSVFEEYVRDKFKQVDLVVGLDARGFLFGPLLAQRLGVGFVLVRKKGKLPGATVSVAYDLEYGKFAVLNPQQLRAAVGAGAADLNAEAEIQADAVSPGQKVILIDDLLATGGTLFAACALMNQLKADVLGCLVVVELKDLNGADKLKPHPVYSLLQYE